MGWYRTILAASEADVDEAAEELSLERPSARPNYRSEPYRLTKLKKKKKRRLWRRPR